MKPTGGVSTVTHWRRWRLAVWALAYYSTLYWYAATRHSPCHPLELPRGTTVQVRGPAIRSSGHFPLTSSTRLLITRHQTAGGNISLSHSRMARAYAGAVQWRLVPLVLLLGLGSHCIAHALVPSEPALARLGLTPLLYGILTVLPKAGSVFTPALWGHVFARSPRLALR